MFTEKLKNYAEVNYEKRLALFGEEGALIQKKMENCAEEERVLMQYFYATMPLRDAGEYDFLVFLGYVRHALFLRREVKWCADLPEDVFLHHVLYYRINSEDITDCRGFFYEQLKDRIKGKTLTEAVVEVNYWCAENMTYEAADDRTISPMTAYRSGSGRCGEESTFTVTALRSVGIPARQVYTPRWAHCDDNHAWVEVRTEEGFQFIGACEPEEVLNRGWFAGASARAFVIHSRTFGSYYDETVEEGLGMEDILTFYNSTETYADCARLSIRVTNEAGTPVEGARVTLEILNMAEFFKAVTLYTDAEGRTGLTLGKGDILIRAVKGDFYAEGLFPVKEGQTAELVLKDTIAEGHFVTDTWSDMEIKAPADGTVKAPALTEEQKERNSRRLKESAKIRENRVEAYYRADQAKAYEGAEELLHIAKGNFDELMMFLQKDGDANRLLLLKSLVKKDCKDAKANVLEEHLQEAKPYVSKEGFVDYIQCPRISHEELTDYRRFILSYFSDEQKEAFRSDPAAIWQYIESHIGYEKQADYTTLLSTPKGCLKLKQGNPVSRRILFVAICRTLGIPARFNKVLAEAEILKDGVFHQITGVGKAAAETASAKLTLNVEDRSKWNYYLTWTIGCLKGTDFVTLNYENYKFEDEDIVLTLPEGIYRLITTSRMPNGNQQVKQRIFALKAGEHKTMELSLYEFRVEDMLVENTLPDFALRDASGLHIEAAELLAGRTNILAFLDEGKEPTEHVLNEMLERAEELSNIPAQILFVVQDKGALENRTLDKTLKSIPNILVYYGEFGACVEPLARRMYVDPEKLPLLILTKPGMTGVYATSGYNVGSVDLIMKLV